MNCSPFDIRDYVFKELSGAENQQMETHLHACTAWREEAERLRLTEAALFSLRDEEIPQRIAFVSDKIFEPSPWRRAWAAFWSSGARLGFASAAMLSVSLIVFSLARTEGRPAPPSPVRVVSQAALSEAEIQQRVQSAVDQAVAASEARLQKSFDQRVADIQKRNQASLALFEGQLDWAQRDSQIIARSSFVLPRSGESK